MNLRNKNTICQHYLISYFFFLCLYQPVKSWSGSKFFFLGFEPQHILILSLFLLIYFSTFQIAASPTEFSSKSIITCNITNIDGLFRKHSIKKNAAPFPRSLKFHISIIEAVSQRSFVKTMFSSSTCARVSFLVHLQAINLQFYENETMTKVFFRKFFLYKINPGGNI